MSAPERSDVLAVLDAFATDHLQVCCGHTVGGGYDEDGNGEPPQCCGRPLTSDDLRDVRDAIAALIEADRAFNRARENLSNSKLGSVAIRMKRFADAKDVLAAAFARCQPDHLPSDIPTPQPIGEGG